MIPPLPENPEDAARVVHTALRRRILYNLHKPDIFKRLTESVGHIRRDAWGPMDMTSNPMTLVWGQAAALYNEAPNPVIPPGGEAAAAAIDANGHWQRMQRTQRDCLGLREMCVKVLRDADGMLENLQPVSPHLVTAEVDPRKPWMPVALTETQRDPDNPDEWIRVTWDIRVPSMVARTLNGHDISDRVLGGDFAGENYPDWVNGEPVLPWIIYHAADTGFLWDWSAKREVVEGTLQLGVLYSNYSHIMRNAAWAQKWAVGVRPAGLQVPEDGNRSEVVTDPAVLLMLSPTDEGVTPMVGQWETSADPEVYLNSIIRYESRLTEMAMGMAEVTKQSSDIRSGYSLAVSREAKVALQVKDEPMFRRSDTALMALVSGLMGGPTEGWDITYPAVERFRAEQKAKADTATADAEKAEAEAKEATNNAQAGTE